MHTAGLKGEVYTNENRQSRTSLRADDEDQVRWGPPHDTLGKSFFEVTQAIERNLQRFHTPKLMEYVTHGDRAGVEAYGNSTSTPFSIFWDFEQGSTMRLAGIPIESKFYLVGNAVIARGLFEYSGAAGLGAPVRICVSQRDGEETRIDMDLPSAFFSKFPEMRPSAVPALRDEKLLKVFEDAAA